MKDDRGRGLRKFSSRDLLRRLLPRGRSKLLQETQSPRDASNQWLPALVDAAGSHGAAEPRTHDSARRLSRLRRQVSRLDLAAVFAADEAGNANRTSPTGISPSTIPGPGIDSNVQVVEALHPGQWPVAVPRTRSYQAEPAHAELLRGIQARQSLLCQASAVSAVVAGPLGLSGAQASTNSIAEVLARREPPTDTQEGSAITVPGPSTGPQGTGTRARQPKALCARCAKLELRITALEKELAAGKSHRGRSRDGLGDSRIDSVISNGQGATDSNSALTVLVRRHSYDGPDIERSSGGDQGRLHVVLVERSIEHPFEAVDADEPDSPFWHDDELDTTALAGLSYAEI